MKENKISAKKTARQDARLKKEEAAKLRKQLILGPDLLIDKKGSDKALDQRILKVELICGRTIDLEKYNEYFNSTIRDYEKRIPQAWYHQVFRLHGWTIPKNGIIVHKPGIVAKYTVDILYGRFPKEVLPILEKYNPINEFGFRRFKHFQRLSPEADLRLQEYIQNSLAIMKKCTYWDEFVSEHAKAYGHPFQTSLFDE